MAIDYTKILSDAHQAIGTPNALPSVTIASGDKRLVRVGMPSQGRLTGVDVFQTGGTSVAFVVDVLKSQAPFAPDTDVSTGTSPSVELNSIRVLPQLSASSGAHASLEDDNKGYAYRNIDGGWTNNQRYLYVLITPTGAATSTKWDIFLTCESDVR